MKFGDAFRRKDTLRVKTRSLSDRTIIWFWFLILTNLRPVWVTLASLTNDMIIIIMFVCGYELVNILDV